MTPRDWKAAAQAFAPDIPADAIERIAPSLDKLEAAFGPLATKIPLETEPASVLLVARDQDAK
jgi:hypothetical protein